MNLLSPKDPNEIIPLVFDFAESLEGGDTITGTPTVTVTVYEGTDASPSDILSGTVSVTGDRVRQNVRNGVDGVKYLVRVTASTTGGLKFTLGAILPVAKAGT